MPYGAGGSTKPAIVPIVLVTEFGECSGSNLRREGLPGASSAIGSFAGWRQYECRDRAEENRPQLLRIHFIDDRLVCLCIHTTAWYRSASDRVACRVRSGAVSCW